MPDFWSDFPGLGDDLERVAARMGEVCWADSAVAKDALASLFNGEGKLLRPGLFLIAARFGRIDPDKRIALAAALEILHTATLVHDDVIDDSPLRRGLPTVHARYGRKDAVLVGDYLLSRCFLLTAGYTTPENAVRLAKAMSVICLQEIEQDMDRFRCDKSIRRYLRKILGKTALLFALAAQVGASESKAPAAAARRLRRAGYAIGMAFQIIDDILDYGDDADMIGKPVGNDLRAGLSTLPLLCALRADDGRLAAAVDAGRFPTADVPTLIELVKERGGIDAARSYAKRYTERALAVIAELPAGGARDMLERLARRLLDRRY
jgi:heptaprenyl diphosphate synthase